MSESAALAVIDVPVKESESVGTLMRRATDVAGVCKEIVLKTAQAIQGRKYVRVEGWMSIAAAYGCVASARDVEVVAGGVRAIGELRRISDGQVVAVAEGFVGDDEKMWAGRPTYARRAMAQTRAVSRVCRSAFAFVVVLIDGNLATTPAEEMTDISDEVKAAAPVGAAALKAQLAPNPAPASPPKQRKLVVEEPPAANASHDRNLTMGFARDGAVPLGKLSKSSLEWYAKVLDESIEDPDKARFAEDNQNKLDAIHAEMKFRGV